MVGQNVLLRVLGGFALESGRRPVGGVDAHASAVDAGRLVRHRRLTRIAGGHPFAPRPAQRRAMGDWHVAGLYHAASRHYIGSNKHPIVVGMLFALGLAFMGTAMPRRYTDADLKTAWFRRPSAAQVKWPAWRSAMGAYRPRGSGARKNGGQRFQRLSAV